ncbi:AMP-binding protein [Teredinibacter purpureus]|uniref:AMP-binding protein n=1 Tax=Teredinibacter purpureus TaxID=2731756 RepID=UPI0005F8463A|nr:AMP-binding protein [Teredinibacter purpureus]
MKDVNKNDYEIQQSLWDHLESCDDKGIEFFIEDKLDFNFYSYQELYYRSLTVKDKLEALGVSRGDRVLLCAQNSPEFVLTWLGLWMLGAVPVPMPPSITMSGGGSFSQRVAPLLNFHQFFICERNDHMLWQALPNADMVEFVEMKNLTSVAMVSPLSVEPNRENSVERRVAYEDDAFIQYTSGSTSAPKGIIISYRNVTDNISAITERIGVTSERDTYISWLPTYHDYGLVANFLMCLFNQIPMVMVTPFYFVKRPLRFMEFVQRFQATCVCMPNFALEVILRAVAIKKPKVEDLNISSLRWWSVAAEPIAPETITALRNVLGRYGLGEGVINPSYGLAEATVGVSGNAAGGEILIVGGEKRFVANGPLLRGFDYELRDVQPDGSGRLHLRGDSVAKWAYVDGERVALLDEKGFCDTRDIAVFKDDELIIFGRGDEMFSRRGENIFPYDIECFVRNYAPLQVRRAACFNLVDPVNNSEKLVVLYESRIKKEAFHTTIKPELFAQIQADTGVKVDEILWVPAHTIPVTTSGKIQRTKAASLYTSSIHSYSTAAQ